MKKFIKIFATAILSVSSLAVILGIGMGANTGVGDETYLETTAAPGQTCSATSYNGVIAFTQAQAFYQCSNNNGGSSYTWNLITPITSGAQYDIAYYGSATTISGAAVSGFGYFSTGGVPVAATQTNLAGLVNVTQYNILESNGAGSAIIGIACTAGKVLQGSATNPSCTATPTLGASGTLGSITMGNATSGTITLEPATGALGTPTIYIPVPPNTGEHLAQVVVAGTSSLGTGAIASGVCASVVTTTAANVVTTDVIGWGFNGDPTGVTGYKPTTNGMLTIIAYPSAGNVNFKVCNNTSASITPAAITLNWSVVR